VSAGLSSGSHTTTHVPVSSSSSRPVSPPSRFPYPTPLTVGRPPSTKSSSDSSESDEVPSSPTPRPNDPPPFSEDHPCDQAFSIDEEESPLSPFSQQLDLSEDDSWPALHRDAMMFLRDNISSFVDYHSTRASPHYRLIDVKDLSLPRGKYLLTHEGLQIISARSSSRVSLFSATSFFPSVDFGDPSRSRAKGYTFYLD